MRFRCLSVVALCGFAGVMCACVNSENGRLALDHGLVLEGVNPGRAERLPPLERFSAAEHGLRPSASSLDRSEWLATRIRVPAGGVRHRPSYTDEWVPGYAERNDGYAPTLLSALDKGETGLEMGVAEGITVAAYSLFDALALVPRALFVDPFWEFNDSPEMQYERRPMRPWIPLAMNPEAQVAPVRGDDATEIAPGRIQRITEPRVEVTIEENPVEAPVVDEPPVEPSEGDTDVDGTAEEETGVEDPPGGLGR